MRISYRVGLVGVATVMAAAAALWLARSASAAAERSQQLAAGRGSSQSEVRSASSEVLTAGTPATVAGHLDRAELSRSIDARVEEQMKKFDLPGAVVVVVHGGEVVHSRGYGQADIEAGRGFDPATT